MNYKLLFNILLDLALAASCAYSAISASNNLILLNTHYTPPANYTAFNPSAPTPISTQITIAYGEIMAGWGAAVMFSIVLGFDIFRFSQKKEPPESPPKEKPPFGIAPQPI